MKNKLIVLVLMMLVISSGCLRTGTEVKINTTVKLMTINYIDKNNIINGEDFPDFKLIGSTYYITPENLTLTLETETGHGVYEMNANTDVLKGYRLYGGSEAYNSSKRYIVLQYKVFDSNESLNDTIDMTAEEIYIKNGFKYKPVNNTYKERVVILESNVTNYTDMNVIVILFGFDTVIGKIGVQDYNNKSLNESLKILDTVFDRIKVKTKEVKAAKLNVVIPTHGNNT